LDEVLELLAPVCKSKGLKINIELKTSVIHYEGIEEKTHELVKAHGLEDHVVYSSFWADSIKRMKELAPQVPTGMLSGSLSECIRWGTYAGADALHPWIGGFDMPVPDDWKQAPVRAYNGEEPFWMDGRILRETHLEKYAAFGATDLFTNVPELYLK
jgi:glycerophosphoryl diester phosphodiesterase